MFPSMFGDDIFGDSINNMHRMMADMHSHSMVDFGGINNNAMMSQQRNSRMMLQPFSMQMASPFALMNSRMNSMFGNMNSLLAVPTMQSMQSSMIQPGSSFSMQSSSFTSYSSNGGQPRIVQKSTSTKIGPNGVKETKKSMSDSATGQRKMYLGRHIGEKAHIKEKSENHRTGEAEESQEFVNLEEDEAESFHNEFDKRFAHGHSSQRALHSSYHGNRHQPYSHRHNNHRHQDPPAAIEYHKSSHSDDRQNKNL